MSVMSGSRGISSIRTSTPTLAAPWGEIIRRSTRTFSHRTANAAAIALPTERCLSRERSDEHSLISGLAKPEPGYIERQCRRHDNDQANSAPNDSSAPASSHTSPRTE